MKLFNRSISVDVDDDGDRLRLTGRLDDTRDGTPLHGIEVVMIMSVYSAEIVEITGSMPVRPMEECLTGLDSLQLLVGHEIKPGYSDLVKGTIGSRVGCTHLAALMMNMGNTSVLGRYAFMRRHVTDERQRAGMMLESAEHYNLVNSCVCWHEDGPLVSRWRAGEERSAQ